MSGASNREVEIKLRLQDADHGKRLLESAGFQVVRPRLFERNTLFDTAGRALLKAGLLLRVRECGGEAVVTFKGRSTRARHKSREELEVTVSDAGTFSHILSSVGFQPAFRYEKYRTEYSGSESGGLATIDETPIGAFLELEGAPDWIDTTAARLGFTTAEYITQSYGSLYLKHRRKFPLSPPDMLFPVKPPAV